MAGPKGVERGSPIILYDGVCGLCNRLNRFVLRRDKEGRFRFASLQSGFAREVLKRHGRDPDDLDTFYLVLSSGEAGEEVLEKGRAALEVLRMLGGVWKLPALLRFLPVSLLNAGYGFVARRRYRWFGKFDACPIPEPRHRDRFIEV